MTELADRPPSGPCAHTFSQFGIRYQRFQSIQPLRFTSRKEAVYPMLDRLPITHGGRSHGRNTHNAGFKNLQLALALAIRIPDLERRKIHVHLCQHLEHSLVWHKWVPLYTIGILVPAWVQLQSAR